MEDSTPVKDRVVGDRNDLLARIYELQDQVKRLEAVLQSGVCKTCGGVSWDIPLADYCRCQDGKPRQTLIDLINKG